MKKDNPNKNQENIGTEEELKNKLEDEEKTKKKKE